MHRGQATLLVACAVNKHNALLHQSLASDQLIVGRIIDNIIDPYFVSTTLSAPGKIPHIQSQGTVPLIASMNLDCVCVVRNKLNVGGKLS